MVGVIVGQHNGGKMVYFHAADLICGAVSGVDIAVAAAAVHHNRVRAGVEQHTLALSHVDGHGVHGAVMILPAVKTQGEKQRQNSQETR